MTTNLGTRRPEEIRTDLTALERIDEDAFGSACQ
jgi:hypothetical protein